MLPLREDMIPDFIERFESSQSKQRNAPTVGARTGKVVAVVNEINNPETQERPEFPCVIDVISSSSTSMDFAKTMASFGGEHHEYLWTIKHRASGRKVFYPFTVFAQPLAEELFDENHCEAAFTNITYASVPPEPRRKRHCRTRHEACGP
ncbi:hypothetical protein PGQ11_003150 [Apiospora arundinis]|uniref:Uncharacterized protein n=1 Tax=Apiospora arundinis TaxID=335852 RepID=A0ABR2J514_9PEZI